MPIQLAVLAAVLISSAETPNLELLKTDLLVVTAHPDDETMMAATMARYADEGKVVALVTCTQGEGGGNGTGKEGGVSLGVVREAELRRCLAILGVRHLYFLHQLDWAYTESVQATLAKWGHQESLRRLVRLVRLLRPEVICTMDPTPVGGQHGHHQAAGRLATEAFEATADPGRFPELARDEGLSPWRVRKLYWSSFRDSTVRITTDGLAKGVLAAASPGKRYSEIGWEAARQHHSQGFDKFFASVSATGPRPSARPNGFLLVKSRVLINPREEKDLFDGIGSPFDGPEAAHDVLAERYAMADAPLVVQLRPRDNVVNYREWLKANGIARLMTRMPAHVTVVRGSRDQCIEVEVFNNRKERRECVVSLELPAGWHSAAPSMTCRLPAGGTSVLRFACTVPAEAAVKSHEVTVKFDGGQETGSLDVVPVLKVKKLTAAPPVDADPEKWIKAGIAAVPIPSTNVVQGSIKDPKECSGRFYVGYDQAGLQVLVDVTDDTVARNIAPDDIKAHWRSTSVEICLDPKPPSENTFSTFKLGIFPQDTTGKVRGARDADARPGPLERIDSRIKLASRRTPAGYIVEANIPWNELGVSAVASGQILGFNVILYHAGKKSARVGEDIGKARLAWSFWPGVPGRPEVWGRATLE
jgi:LmbE family N-acetylglucosaminyl deacetylase